MHTQVLMILALVAGALMPLQAGINGQVAQRLDGALNAALLSFTVGTLVLLILCVVQREMPTPATLKGIAPWQWLGGLLGAFFITTAAIAGPRLGALSFLALILAGQMSMSLVLDHFGWLGFRHSPISATKLAGLGCMVLGLWLILRR